MCRPTRRWVGLNRTPTPIFQTQNRPNLPPLLRSQLHSLSLSLSSDGLTSPPPAVFPNPIFRKFTPTVGLENRFSLSKPRVFFSNVNTPRILPKPRRPPLRRRTPQQPLQPEAMVTVPSRPYSSPHTNRFTIYERALKSLPGSYKLWYAFLRERLELVRNLPITHKEYQKLNNTFERALVTMHKMPRIWIMYLLTLTEQKLVTKTRRTFDRALCALPVTQHDRIWEPYLVFVSQRGVPIETSLRVYILAV